MPHPVQRPPERDRIPQVPPPADPSLGIPTGPQWVQVPGRGIEPTRTAALVAQVLAGVFLLTTAVSAALSYRAADAVTSGEFADPSLSEPVLTHDLFGGVVFVAGVATWISTSVWLARARRNAEAISTMRHQRSRVWVWLCWIVPFVSLWFPRQVVRDVHRASHPELAPPARLNLWWALWVVGVAISNAGGRIALSGDMDNIGGLGPVNTVSTLLLAAAYVPWVLIVRRITTLQEAAARQVAGGAPPS